jgi:hypothetical protein
MDNVRVAARSEKGREGEGERERERERDGRVTVEAFRGGAIANPRDT